MNERASGPLTNRSREMLRLLSLLSLLSSSTAMASNDAIDFVRDVRPILVRHCYECHGPEKQKSGLRLDIKAAAFKGGELYDASIVSGDAQSSPLIQFIVDEDADLQMPPDGDGLSPDEEKILVRWVNEGAVWPDGVDTAKLEDRLDHWSYKPLSHPAVPQVAQGDWARNDIDRFILRRLEESGLEPSPEIDRIGWLRRVSFDLTGLPPSPADAQAFLSDRSAAAYERVVDRLLDSPRYGERWAQHWLDVVRYADTHGFEVNTERPHAWPYRDYVIRAFNDDLPYDQFIREQIVGDAYEADAATGFLVTASVLLPGQIGKDAPSMRLARQDAIDEIVVNIGQTFLGLSIGCARCHDHKFDPISQRDYYAMQAFVAGVEYGDREILTPEIRKLRSRLDQVRTELAQIDRQLTRFAPLAKSGTERPMVSARRNVDRFEAVRGRRLRFTIRSTNRFEPCIDELEVYGASAENLALSAKGTKVKASGSKVSPNRHELRFLNDGLYGNSRSWMSDEVGGGWVELEFPEVYEIDRVLWGRDREGKFSDRLAIDYLIEVETEDGEWRTVADASDRAAFDPKQNSGDADSAPPVAAANLTAEQQAELARWNDEREALEKQIQAAKDAPKVFAGVFRKPDDIHLLARGDPERPKDPVAPAVLRNFGTLELARDSEEQDRRRALADWIASSEHPLTARVMVNRIWQGHFGVGLVETASDFGRSGQPPSHPELLDWLATQFITTGWSVKAMHRQIVLSATYRQAAAASQPAAEAIDADARLLWRYPSRRLEAESIRDSMLAISGRLNLEMYGPGYNLFDKRGGLTGFNPVVSFSEDGLRRMVYAHKVRRERDAVFGAFDCPDAGQSTPRRRESTTPIQALNLFNSQFTFDQSLALADRIETEVGDTVDQQIRRAFQLAYLRQPDNSEVEAARPVVEAHGLATLCRVLFNSNEFLFIP